MSDDTTPAREDASTTAQKQRASQHPLTHLPDGTPLPIEVGEIQKNKKEVLRLQFAAYNGKILLQARVWYRTADGEMRPSKDGWALQPQLADQVSLLFTMASMEARTRGWTERKDAAE